MIALQQSGLIHGRGPWPTKSGGQLTVPLTLSFYQPDAALGYRSDELAILSPGTWQQRIMTMSDLPIGPMVECPTSQKSTEIICVINGGIMVDWLYLPLSHKGRTCSLATGQGLVMPPGTQHSIRVMQDNTELLFVQTTTGGKPLCCHHKQEDLIPTIEQVQYFCPSWSQTTLLGGSMRLWVALAGEELSRFYSYDPREMSRLPLDIRGGRVYLVQGVQPGRIGGTEYHRIREEIVVVTRGKIEWLLEDLKGDKARFTLKAGQGFWIPPGILHAYQALEDSDILAMTNILFGPNKDTWDTHSAVQFQARQRELGN